MNAQAPLLPPTVLDRLLSTAPRLEIWWDSSPLIYQHWMEKLIASAPQDKQTVLAAQLLRLFDPQNPQKTLFTGVTTNPPLSLAAINDNPERWAGWINDYTRTHPDQDARQVFWALYKEIIRLGAETYLPVFEASDFAYGHLSGQVDPHYFFDADTMLSQAVELSSLAPNIAIKIPGTQQGMQVIRELTARGISTNCTAAYGSAIHRRRGGSSGGAARSKAAGLLTVAFGCHVHECPLGKCPGIRRTGKGGWLSDQPEDRWAAVAIFKQAYRIFRQRAISKL
jgi:transaldolase